MSRADDSAPGNGAVLATGMVLTRRRVVDYGRLHAAL
jgi:hypothetical protein